MKGEQLLIDKVSVGALQCVVLCFWRTLFMPRSSFFPPAVINVVP